MDDMDLHLLREFRADEAAAPEHLAARIEERLWQAILEEERRKGAAGVRARRGRWSTLLRPALAATAAVVLVVGVAVVSDGGTSTGPQVSSGGVTQASGGLLDGTARALFGSDSAAASAAGPVVGRIDLQTDGDGALTQPSADAAATLTRNPRALRDELRTSVASSGHDDPTDTIAFRVAVAWIVDPVVPTDLRAAMLRSIGGLEGIDDARTGVDMLGRPGVILGHVDARTGIRTQAVLDGDTGTLRELRSFTTTYLDPACPPGTFTEYAAYDDGTWIDPSTQPFVAWPQVVAACGPR